MKLLTIWIAKTIFTFIRLFGFGNGYVFPAHIVLKIFPHTLSPTLFSYPGGVILVSGTNGKTTTVKLITHILRKKGISVATNSSGSNLLNGLVTTALLDYSLLGKRRSHVAVLEVDELVLPRILDVIRPKCIGLLNLSRDQLDRYGETDAILHKWRAMLKSLSPSVRLFVDAEQNDLVQLSKVFEGKTSTFSADPVGLNNSPLVGAYNAKNIGCALSICSLFGISNDFGVTALKDFKMAFGRGEFVEAFGKHFRLLLAKNPTSFNNNLLSLKDMRYPFDAVLVVLNDGIPDGRDVSWIYDIKSFLIRDAFMGKPVAFAGSRAHDMAIRFSYAGIPVRESWIFDSLRNACFYFGNEDTVHNVLVLPNYSAMLEVRKLLTGKAVL